eukprot:Gb_28555 [translate_table: standard]
MCDAIFEGHPLPQTCLESVAIAMGLRSIVHLPILVSLLASKIEISSVCLKQALNKSAYPNSIVAPQFASRTAMSQTNADEMDYTDEIGNCRTDADRMNAIDISKETKSSASKRDVADFAEETEDCATDEDLMKEIEGKLSEKELHNFCRDASKAFFNEWGLISHQLNSFDDFEETLKSAPDELEALEGAVVTHTELGEYSEAAALLEKITQKKPKDLEAFRLLGEVRYSLKDFEGSVVAYWNAIMKSNTDSLEILRGLTNALLAADGPNEVVQELLSAWEKLRTGKETQHKGNLGTGGRFGSPEAANEYPLQLPQYLGTARCTRIGKPLSIDVADPTRPYSYKALSILLITMKISRAKFTLYSRKGMKRCVAKPNHSKATTSAIFSKTVTKSGNS